MKKIKIIAGTIWAISGMILILILFPGLNRFTGSAASLSFMKINPNYSGGEVIKHVTYDNYSIDIRKPVFDGLLKEKKTGFVQLDWRGNIPDEIIDTIDYDLDSRADLGIHIMRSQNKTEIDSFNKRVGEVLISTPTSYGWAVRVEVRK